MKRRETIDVQISQRSLGIIIKAFDTIDEHYNNLPVFDNQMLQLSRKDLQDITSKLKSHQALAQNPASIPMNFSDWVVYTSYIGVVDYKSPGMEQEELVLLEDLSEQYFDMDEAGETPVGP